MSESSWDAKWAELSNRDDLTNRQLLTQLHVKRHDILKQVQQHQNYQKPQPEKLPVNFGKWLINKHWLDQFKILNYNTNHYSNQHYYLIISSYTTNVKQGPTAIKLLRQHLKNAFPHIQCITFNLGELTINILSTIDSIYPICFSINAKNELLTNYGGYDKSWMIEGLLNVNIDSQKKRLCFNPQIYYDSLNTFNQTDEVECLKELTESQFQKLWPETQPIRIIRIDKHSGNSISEIIKQAQNNFSSNNISDSRAGYKVVEESYLNLPKSYYTDNLINTFNPIALLEKRKLTDIEIPQSLKDNLNQQITGSEL